MNCPDCDIPMMGIQYDYDDPQHYDGVSEWSCPACRLRMGRWSGRRLAEGEAEFRFAEKENE